MPPLAMTAPAAALFTGRTTLEATLAATAAAAAGGGWRIGTGAAATVGRETAAAGSEVTGTAGVGHHGVRKEVTTRTAETSTSRLLPPHLLTAMTVVVVISVLATAADSHTPPAGSHTPPADVGAGQGTRTPILEATVINYRNELCGSQDGGSCGPLEGPDNWIHGHSST